MSRFFVIFTVFALISLIWAPGSGLLPGKSGLKSEPAGRKSSFLERGRVVAVARDHATVQVELTDHIDPNQVESYFLTKKWQIRDGNKIAGFTCTRVDLQGNRAVLSGILDRPVKMGAVLGEMVSLGEHRPPVDYKPAESSAPVEIIHPLDRKRMRLIPSDYLVYGQGDDPQADNYNPYFFHRSQKLLLQLDSFYMDVYEVTNREYYRFCREAGHPLPAVWQKTGSYKPGTADHPVTVVTYEDALAYANWSRKELPDELQWELAARGGLSILADATGPQSLQSRPKLYPYGNDFEPDRCNTLERWKGNPVTLPVTKMNDASPYGILGMCGNAPEWTVSYYNPYPGHRFSNGDYTGRQLRVIRGGGFFLPSRLAATNARWPAGFANENKDPIAGFRLIGSVKTLARAGR